MRAFTFFPPSLFLMAAERVPLLAACFLPIAPQLYFLHAEKCVWDETIEFLYYVFPRLFPKQNPPTHFV